MKYPAQRNSIKWADSLLKTLKFEEMFAQMLMIPAWTRDPQVSKSVIDAVEKYQIGGIIFFQGTPQTHVMAINYLQQQSKIPLLVGMDAEWGPAMRLDHVPKFPYPYSIASKQEVNDAFEIGKSQGKMLRELGVHLNFAPVVDVNSNARNPIIGFRSFGDNPYLVSEMAEAFNKGLEHEGVWGCAKHFPGHGNTIADSHLELPEVTHDKKSLKRELIPFQRLIDQGVKSVMMGHLKVPFLDDRPNMPASLSRPIVTGLLREKLDFEGLIITDAMNMKGVSSYYKAEDAVLKAVQAGNDIICFVENVPEVMGLCRSWLDSNWIDSAEIAQSVRRILIAKHQTAQSKFINPENIQSLLDAEYHKYLQRLYSQKLMAYEAFDPKLELEIEAASTQIALLAPEKPVMLPWKPHGKDTLYAVIFGEKLPERFLKRLESYHQTKLIWAQNFTQSDSLLLILDSLNGKFLFFNAGQRMWGSQSRQLPVMMQEVLTKFNQTPKSVLIHTGNPYALRGLKSNIPCILGMETGESYLLACIDGLFGQREISGNLAGVIDEHWSREARTQTQIWYQDLGISSAENVGISTDCNAIVEHLMDSVLQSGASVSAQLIVVKDGKITHNISRGFEHESSKKVNMHTIYDVASITKIAATTLAVMHVYEKEQIDLNASIKEYWPEASQYAWGDVKIHQFLSHRSGLPATLPLFQEIQTRKMIPDSIMIDSGIYSYQLWDRINANSGAVKDSIWTWICNTSTQNQTSKTGFPTYIYSDLNPIILGKWIEYKSGVGLDRFCDSLFYQPMGLFRTGFKPLEKGLNAVIMPTEIDSIWGRGLIKATVHDPTAALMGGVAGNAGLFSSAHDLSRLMLMLCNGGELNNHRYFKKETIDRFTRRQSPDFHRGLGFDKPNGFPSKSIGSELKSNNVFDDAPMSLFGHSGFTGTWAWADPEQKLVFVFLSNRTFPKDKHNLLAKLGFRGKLLQSIYQSLKPHH